MPDSTQRKLAAIVSADVVGYSRLMQADEAGTHVRLQARFRDLVVPMIDRFGGRLIKQIGDGVLAEFSSVVSAADWALAVQGDLARANADEPDAPDIEFRIGVNLGDVIVDGTELYGDGVNLVTRLQEVAGACGVCLSDAAYQQVRGKLQAEFLDGGRVALKNITRPTQVWHWPSPNAGGTTPAGAVVAGAPPRPDKPSIAVLPFDNMSGDPEQQFFADGIAEDVITALSRFRSLFVIARNSSFTYRADAVDIVKVAEELGVRYVVEGSVRKARDRVRITAQLIDADDGNHLWADRFDGNLDDVFDLQDQITEQIVVSVEPEIGARERERSRRKPPDNLDAWELLQRGLSHSYHINEKDHLEAIRRFREAIRLDPEFAAAHAYLAYSFWVAVLVGYAEDKDRDTATARAAAELAISLDPNEPVARLALGRIHIEAGEIDLAIAAMRTAISINPNFAWAHFGLGYAHLYGAGRANESLPHFDAALRLSPRDPWRWRELMIKGMALRALGRHDEAIENCRQACQFPNRGAFPHIHLAAALAEAGRLAEANAAINEARRIQPSLTLATYHEKFASMHETAWNSIAESLRRAGLPE